MSCTRGTVPYLLSPLETKLKDISCDLTYHSYHVKYCQPWVIASLAILGVDFLVRAGKVRIKSAKVVAQTGGITQITFDDVRSGWKAGQHVWVRRISGRDMLEGGQGPFDLSRSP